MIYFPYSPVKSDFFPAWSLRLSAWEKCHSIAERMIKARLSAFCRQMIVHDTCLIMADCTDCCEKYFGNKKKYC
jgi:hypothetical protein